MRNVRKPEARQAAKPGRFGVFPNPSLALQASMAREVSFSNGAAPLGGTDLQLQEYVETSHVSCPPKVPPTGELPALRIQVRQSRERLDPLAIEPLAK